MENKFIFEPTKEQVNDLAVKELLFVIRDKKFPNNNKFVAIAFGIYKENRDRLKSLNKKIKCSDVLYSAVYIAGLMVAGYKSLTQKELEEITGYKEYKLRKIYPLIIDYVDIDEKYYIEKYGNKNGK